MTIKERYEALKLKIAGSARSKTIWLSSIWATLVLNIDTIQSLLPQAQQYLGDHIADYINKAFFILLVYVRLFQTKGPVEDKVKDKE